MFLRTLPLRFKLIAAVLLPLMVVIGFLGLSVVDGVDARSNADEQLAEVARFDAVVDYAAALSDEAQVLNDAEGSPAELADRRVAVDEAWSVLERNRSGIGSDRFTSLDAIHSQALEIRGETGDDPRQYQLDSAGIAIDNVGVLAPVRLNALRSDLLDDFGFDRSSISDPETVQALADVQLLQRIEANIANEAGLLFATWNRFGPTLDASAVGNIQAAVYATDESLSAFDAFASPEAVAEIAPLLESDTFFDLQQVRDTVRPDNFTGLAMPLPITEVRDRITEAVDGLTMFEQERADRLEALAIEAEQSAENELIRAGVIGGGLLLVVSIIVFALYQAIRQPLRDLTREARRVSDVELPEVVQAIRRGDIDEVPEIDEIDAFSDDEIGELVAAFNGMHRTAVGLAAEQAGSRRVVADMFVNLGRRNQKLLNRMLKGLTVLEREEEDPDKLDALYKVDHLATRMRRNAESLLVLAGASQARTWPDAVPVYDVIQSALAEVENFERVEIDVVDGEDIEGDYVADLAHILAELIENALAFSPPTSTVEIVARHTRRGYAVVINDAGIGMPPEQLDIANQQIVAAGSQDETPSEFLGHFVVGRLAARHGFDVDLLEGLTGTSARVTLPSEVFGGQETEPESGHAGDLGDLHALTSLSSLPAPDQSTAAADHMAPFEEAFASMPADSLPLDVFDSPDETLEWADDDASDPTPVSTPVPVADDAVATEGEPVDEPPLELPRRQPKRHLATPPAGEPAPIPEPALETVPSHGGGEEPFSVRRRKGANLPVTTITPRAIEADLDDPDAVRSSLSGFQSGTTRADKENH